MTEILQYIDQLYQQFNLISKENQILATGISLWGLSLFTYLVRGVPSSIFNFISNQATTKFSFTNAGNDVNQNRYNAIMKFISERNGTNFSRHLSLRTSSAYSWDGDDRKKSNDEIQPGFATHFFIWNKRLFWYKRAALESSATNIQKETVTIYTFGRSHKPFYDIYEAVFPPVSDNIMKLFSYSVTDGWEERSKVVKRPISTVLTSNGVKEAIIDSMQKFMESEQWYVERGISWKEVYVLHGPPGTGKTSLIKALASHFNLNIYEIDLSKMSNDSFSRALSSLPPKSICIIEDFDSADVTKARKNVEAGSKRRCIDEKESDRREDSFDLSSFSPLTLSGILNALDGISNLHGCMVFMTTNCIGKIDQAILRKGRTDFNYEIGYLTDVEIKDYIKLVFPDLDTSGLTFEDMPGCNLYAAFKENRDNPTAFLEAICR